MANLLMLFICMGIWLGDSERESGSVCSYVCVIMWDFFFLIHQRDKAEAAPVCACVTRTYSGNIAKSSKLLSFHTYTHTQKKL